MGVIFMTIWAICKNRLLPNSPKWANSENYYGKAFAITVLLTANV